MEYQQQQQQIIKELSRDNFLMLCVIIYVIPSIIIKIIEANKVLYRIKIIIHLIKIVTKPTRPIYFL